MIFRGDRIGWIFILTACPLFMRAQEPSARRYQEQHAFDLSVAGADGRFSTALSWSHLHGIGKKKQKLQIGYGLRFTTFVAANKYYTTAPAEYTSTQQGIGTIFSETIDENIDTITTATALTFSLNLATYIQYTLTSKIDIGCNIDVIGFSFGPSKSFNVISSVYDAAQQPVQRASPTSFNLLLTSDNDIGSLNSEFFVRYNFNSKISIRAGYAFIFSEYRTDNQLSFDEARIVNDRYRYKAAMGFVGVTLKPFN